jgi:proton glutamate symport protein
LFLGLSLNHVAEEQRNTVLNFFQAIGSAMLKIVDWVLIIAPLGIFCILFPLASRVGAQLAGALGIYIVIHVSMYALCIVLMYVFVAAFSGIPLQRFIKACFKPQLIALGTQSSIATLPSMITASEEKLRISPLETNVVLPMAISIFKAGTCVTNVIYALFIARVYHIHITGLQWITLFVVCFAAAIGGAGLPSGAAFFAPVLTIFSALGLPVQAIPILFAMDTIPDMAVTVTNVTADMTAISIITRGNETSEDLVNIKKENSFLEPLNA